MRSAAARAFGAFLLTAWITPAPALVALDRLNAKGSAVIRDNGRAIACVQSLPSKNNDRVVLFGTSQAAALGIAPAAFRGNAATPKSKPVLKIGKYSVWFEQPADTPRNVIIYPYGDGSQLKDIPDGAGQITVDIGATPTVYPFSAKGMATARTALAKCRATLTGPAPLGDAPLWPQLWAAFAAFDLKTPAEAAVLGASLRDGRVPFSVDFDQSMALLLAAAIRDEGKEELAELLIDIGGDKNLDDAAGVLEDQKDDDGRKSLLLGRIAEQKKDFAGAATHYGQSASAGNGSGLLAAIALLGQDSPGFPADPARAIAIATAAAAGGKLPQGTLMLTAGLLAGAAGTPAQADQALALIPSGIQLWPLVVEHILANRALPKDWRQDRATSLARGSLSNVHVVLPTLWFGRYGIEKNRKLAAELVNSVDLAKDDNDLVFFLCTLLALFDDPDMSGIEALPSRQSLVDRLRGIGDGKTLVAPVAARLTAYEAAADDIASGRPDQAAARLSSFVDNTLEVVSATWNSTRPLALLGLFAREQGRNGWAPNAYAQFRAARTLSGEVNPPRSVALASTDGTLSAHIEALRCGHVYGALLVCNQLGNKAIASDFRLLVLGGLSKLSPQATMLSAFNAGAGAAIASGPKCAQIAAEKTRLLDGLKACSRTFDYTKLQF